MIFQMINNRNAAWKARGRFELTATDIWNKGALTLIEIRMIPRVLG